MYEILHFRGGVYRFDELKELVEDTGGIVFSMDHFDIIRGDSYLSTEVHVLLMVPENELNAVDSLISEIKGSRDDINITDKQKDLLLSYLSIYDVLNKTGTWTKKEDLKELIICPCFAMLCKNSGDDECQLNNKFDEILEEMCLNGVIEKQILDEKIEYRLKKEIKSK
ncbi:methyl-coenzyme M reductase family protein [Methanobacterium sp.]|uniref:methyl-coenzyme M reductase family protein n=1 Tax=Methanobacterium sp. TaxID=2164 RepID=UPI003D64D9E9